MVRCWLPLNRISSFRVSEPDASPWLPVGTDDLYPATRAGMNGQPEPVQLYDRSHKIEAKAHTRRAPDLVGAVETPQHGFPLLFADTTPGVADAHDCFILAAHQFNAHPTAFRRELDSIVDEVGDRL